MKGVQVGVKYRGLVPRFIKEHDNENKDLPLDRAEILAIEIFAKYLDTRKEDAVCKQSG